MMTSASCYCYNVSYKMRLVLLGLLIALAVKPLKRYSIHGYSLDTDTAVRYANDDDDGDVTMSDEKRLIKYLLDQYETFGVIGRPVINTSQTIRVQYGLALIQILDVDEKNQVLTTNVWNRYTWNDALLRWGPTEFGGIETVRVPVAKIWTPDIVLYNYADDRLKEQRDTMAVITFDGTVLWIPPAIFKSTCSIDVTNFPFDTQECKLKFGSWTYDGFRLDIQFYDDNGQVDVSDYINSNEWDLVDHPGHRNVRYYPCCSDQPFPDLTFTIRIRRISIFYKYILILPCILLSVLTLVIFWLPPESPAKMMLGMSVFVAFFVLLMLLADNTPPVATSIPLIGAHFFMNMVLITLSTFLAVVVVQTHVRGDRINQVPGWLRRVTLLGLARVLCMTDVYEYMMATVSCNSQLHSTGHHPHARHSRQRCSRTAVPPKSSQRLCDTEVTLHQSQKAVTTTTLLRRHQTADDDNDNRHMSLRPTATHNPDIPLAGNSLQPEVELDRIAAAIRSGTSLYRAGDSDGCLAEAFTDSKTFAASSEEVSRSVRQHGDRWELHNNKCARITGAMTPNCYLRRSVDVTTPTEVTVRSSDDELHQCQRSDRFDHCFPTAFDTRRRNVNVQSSSSSSAAAATIESHRYQQQPHRKQTHQQSVDATSAARTPAWIAAIAGDIRDIRRMLKSYLNRKNGRDLAARAQREWRLVARVLDRLFFYLYCAAVIVSLIALFPSTI